jgi:DNA replication and repair protein RecF
LKARVQNTLFYLESLHLSNFRNYSKLKINFHPRLNIISGENGQGKTNLIEAVYFLSVTRSFRTNRDQELSGFPELHFFIKGQFIKDDYKSTIQINYKDKQLKVIVDNDRKNRFDHLQQFPVVAFSPDDLLIIREGPATRRRYINLEASRLNQRYFLELRAYHRVLLQRGRLLKENRNRREIEKLLEPWDDALITHGSVLIRLRRDLVRQLAVEAAPFFSRLTAEQEELSLDYICSVPSEENSVDLEQQFREALLKKRELELRRQTNSVGPHLDDICIMINGRDSRKYSSQGQKRTAALALKMAEVRILKQKNGNWPILLLDDVFSEFDCQRKEQLLDFLTGIESQCFLTAAVALDHLPAELTGCFYQINVQRGMIQQ